MGQIKGLSDKHHVPVLLIHHLRKTGSDDVFDTVSGSLGLTGAADSLLILDRGSGTADASLHITGRDIEEAEIALQLDKGTLTWQYMGSADEVRSSTGQQTILDALKASDEAMSPREIADTTGLKYQYVKNVIPNMTTDRVIKKVSYGKYIYFKDSEYSKDSKYCEDSKDSTGTRVLRVPGVLSTSRIPTECLNCKKNYQCLDCEHGARQQAAQA